MKLDDIAKLRMGKYRRQFRKVFVDGERFRMEAEASAHQQTVVYHTEAYEHVNSRFETHLLTERQFRKISDVDHPQGIGVLLDLNEFTTARTADQIVYLDDIQDPGNLGSIIRSMAWFGLTDLRLSAASVDPYNPKVLRAAMGGHFHVMIRQDVDPLTLPDLQRPILALDLQGEAMMDQRLTDSCVIVIGNEGRGISERVLSLPNLTRLRIYGVGRVESLNAAAAAAITFQRMTNE